LPLQKAFGTNSNPVQRIAHDREVVSARLRNDEALALPIEKLDRQFSLKRLDLLAHRALRDTELFRGAGKTLMPGRGFEGFQGIQRWQAWPHRMTS